MHFQQNRIFTSKNIFTNFYQFPKLAGIEVIFTPVEVSVNFFFSDLLHLMIITQGQLPSCYLKHIKIKKIGLIKMTNSRTGINILQLFDRFIYQSSIYWSFSNLDDYYRINIEIERAFISFLQKYVWKANFDIYIETCWPEFNFIFNTKSKNVVKSRELFLRMFNFPIRLIKPLEIFYK